MNKLPNFISLLSAGTALAAILILPTGRLLAETAPGFIWALQASGTKDDSANAVTVDGSGNIYTAGYFNGGSGTGFPLRFGTSGTLTGSGYKDGFITKQNASGVYQWTQKVGGIQNDEVKALCVDNTGNVVVAGYFAQATFGVSGTITLTGAGTAAFIAKMSASTGNFQWVNQLRSTGNQSNSALCAGADSAGNVYLAGYFIGTASMATATGTATLVSTEQGAGSSFFIIKLDTNGNLLWTQVAKGTGSSQINGLCVSGTSSVYVAGSFNNSPQFTTTLGTTTFTNNSGVSLNNTFIAKLDAGTGNFLWVEQVGGDDTVANAVAMSGSNVVVVGNFQNLATFGTSGTLNTTSYHDGFVEKLDSSGTLVWVEQTGFSNDCSTNGLSVDSLGNIYTSGWFIGTATVGSSTMDSADASSALFIAKQNSSGVFLWGQQAVGSTSSTAAANAVAVSGSNLVTAGAFGGYDSGDTAAFPGANTLTNTSAAYSGFSDIFVAELSTVGSTIPAITSSTSVTTTTGTAFDYTITATNSPTSFSANPIPAWAGFDPSTGLLSGTPNVAGTSSITIVALNAIGTGTATLTLVVQNPYDVWRNTYFSTLELGTPSISGDTADPNQNGIPNLMEYALGQDPRASGVTSLPVTVSGSNYLTLTYTRPNSTTDITYTVEVSGNLTGWNSGSSYTLASPPTDNGDGTSTVTVRDLTPKGGNKRFIRLKVIRP